MFNLVSEYGNIKIYKGFGYTVFQKFYNNEQETFDLIINRENDNDNIPIIFPIKNKDNVFDFKILTKNYGFLTIVELEYVISIYEKSILATYELTKLFSL